jgi:acetyl esterase
VLGSPALSDDQARGLAAASTCLVVSVDYRLAPENPFPAGLEDCYAVLSWVADQTERIGVPPNRLAVGGDSAGGNLAAAVTLLARDRGGPKIDFQALIYPALCHQLDTRSRRLYRTGYWLTTDTLQWFSRLYVKDTADLNNPYVSPFLAQSLDDLPPAFILTAEYDILRDEAEVYGDRLLAAGIATQIVRYQGMVHGFIGCAGIISRAWDAMSAVGEAIKNAFVGFD